MTNREYHDVCVKLFGQFGSIFTAEAQTSFDRTDKFDYERKYKLSIVFNEDSRKDFTSDCYAVEQDTEFHAIGEMIKKLEDKNESK